MTTASTTRSSSSRHKPRSRSHSPTHAKPHSKSNAAHARPHSRSHTGGAVVNRRSRPKKHTRSRSNSKDRLIAFRCMRCKERSPSTVEEYVTEQYGGRNTTMAKGFCRQCNGKMSLIVPASSQTNRSSRSHSSRPKQRSRSHSTGSSKAHNSRRRSRSHSSK